MSRLLIFQMLSITEIKKEPPNSSPSKRKLSSKLTLVSLATMATPQIPTIPAPLSTKLAIQSPLLRKRR